MEVWIGKPIDSLGRYGVLLGRCPLLALIAWDGVYEHRLPILGRVGFGVAADASCFHVHRTTESNP